MYQVLLWKLGLILSLLATPSFAQTSDARRTVLIVDASGSMWAKIGDTHKVQMSRLALAQALAAPQTASRLGILAFGHRRKGDCSDIQQIADFDTQRATAIKRVVKLSPRGKAPIGQALLAAYERLEGSQKPANIVLLADGGDTCRRDPCAQIKALQADAVDLTVSVIGFGPDAAKARDVLECVAQAGGGRYFAANSQAELANALGDALSAQRAVDPNSPAQLTLQAVASAAGPVLSTGLSWSIIEAQSGRRIFHIKDAGSVSIAVQAGLYDVVLRRIADGQEVHRKALELHPGRDATERLVLPLKHRASLTAPDGAVVGVNSRIDVAWDGPSHEGDFVALASAGDGVSSFYDRVLLAPGKAVQLQVPIQPGSYELRYVSKLYRDILARSPLEALDVVALVDAQDAVPSGGKFVVNWRGPGTGNDTITMVRMGATDAARGAIASLGSPEPVVMRAPVQEGLYELRYLLGGKRVLARRPVEVTAAKTIVASLRSPSFAYVGSKISVDWNGPAGKADTIALVEVKGPGLGPVVSADIALGNPLELRAPLKPGVFELQYLQGGVIGLVSAPIEIRDVIAEIRAPGEVRPARPFIARVEGPYLDGDVVLLSDPANPDVPADKLMLYDEKEPLQFLAPRKPGLYEIRYLLKGKRVIATQPISVLEQG